jgi:hypothetical protein
MYPKGPYDKGMEAKPVALLGSGGTFRRWGLAEGS